MFGETFGAMVDLLMNIDLTNTAGFAGYQSTDSRISDNLRDISSEMEYESARRRAAMNKKPSQPQYNMGGHFVGWD